VPAIAVLKHEDWPGLAKLSAVRRAEVVTGRRRIAILVGNGGLFLPEELERGADGAMTGFAFPELLVEVCRRHTDGDRDGAADLFDAYLPLIRYEQQPGYGLAVRKRILCARGAIANPDLRPPGARLSNHDLAELQRLLGRLNRRLEREGHTLPVAFPSVGAVA
jgi:4-hydroxy-tetrahydrodipicolinate synthase